MHTHDQTFRAAELGSLQVKVADAHFPTVRKVKAPLLVKASRTLLTDDRHAGACRQNLSHF